jgi:predicted RNase H-like HicB family nuclease
MEAKTSYTAVIQHDGDWWIGWLEEIPGVNSQGRTRESCWRISGRLSRRP